MSVLETRHEDLMTMEAALSFIDSFDMSSDFSSEQGSSADSPLSSPSSESSAVHPVRRLNKPDAFSLPVGKSPRAKKRTKTEGPKRKRASNPPGYTTEVQRRKRAELRMLRDQVCDLEHERDQLKRQKPVVKRDEDDPRTAEQRQLWKLLLATEYEKRRLSEESNARLKTMLGQVVDTAKKLRHLFQKRSLLQGLDFVFGNEPTSSYSFAAFENNKSIVDHLEQKVANLYLDSGSIFQSEPPPAIRCSMQMKHDKVRGKTAEALSTTPMLCPMEVAAEICWKDLSIPRLCPDKWARSIKGKQLNSFEKNWILTLQCQSYVKEVKGTQFLRKYIEPNRIVIIKADVMMLNNEGLQFRDQTWTIISRSETNPNASVVRVCEHIYLDRHVGVASARPEDVDFAQNVVLKNMSWKLREHTQHLQATLVDETEKWGQLTSEMTV